MGDLRLWKSEYPRKGWIEVDCIDTGQFPGGECNFCGTEYRYEHQLFHPDEKLEVSVGVVCAEHLTDDYVNPRRKERLLLKRRRWIMSPKWRSVKRGLYRDGVLVYRKDDFWMLEINGKIGKKQFKSSIDAAKIAFDYLFKVR